MTDEEALTLISQAVAGENMDDALFLLELDRDKLKRDGDLIILADAVEEVRLVLSAWEAAK